MATDYTLAALRQRVHNMALTDDTTNTLADTFINDVYADLVVQGQLKCTMVNKPLTAGSNLYSFANTFGITDLGMVQYIMYKGNGQTQGYILEPSDLETVLQLNSTNPTGYVRKYAFQGLDNLYLWPAPQSGLKFTATTATIANNVMLITAAGSVSGNAVSVSNVSLVSGTTYDITTSTAHGLVANDSVYLLFPSTSNGFGLTNQTFSVVSTSSATVFRISFSGTVVTGAASGYAGKATTQYTVDSIGAFSGTYSFLTFSTGTLVAYVGAGSASYGTCNLYSNNDTLQIYYAQTPTVLSASTDVPSVVPSQWQHLISLGAAARMVDAVGEDITLGTALEAKYEALYKQFVKWVKGRQGRGTQVMPSGYARSTSWPPHDRSSYYSETGPGS